MTATKRSSPAPSERTKAVWAKLQPYFEEEQQKGVLDVDATTPSSLLAHAPGCIDRDNEVIVGLQTDAPFRRAILPSGGLRMVEAGLKAAGFEPIPTVHETFTKYRKTHNDGVFDAYTPEIMRCRRSRHHHRPARCLWPRPHHRRLPPRGAVRHRPAARGQAGRARAARRHVADRRRDPRARGTGRADAGARRPGRRWPSAMAATSPGRPQTAREAVQWTYFGYLGAIKEANGAAMSIGRISTFLDIYIERDLHERHARRERRAGTDRPARAEAAHRPLPAHAGL